MKLSTFQIINCFGFRDSGKIELLNQNNFIYILGRNSSGKSSLLNAISYFEFDKIPSKQVNFENFNKTIETPKFIATFNLCGEKLSYDEYEKKLMQVLKEIYIDKAAIDYNEPLKILIEAAKRIYEKLIEELNSANKIEIHKFHNGGYHFIQNDLGKYNARKGVIVKAIAACKDGSGHINISGNPRNIDIGFNTFEKVLFYQFPKIYIFNDYYSLNDSLPNKITDKWEDSNNYFEKRLINYLGGEDINRILTADDPDERDKIHSRLNRKIKGLANRVNESRSQKERKDLLEIRLDTTTGGLQITVITDGKKSFYSHLSENTKFLFAYHLHHETEEIQKDILLFDEPSNGFHPTAQRLMLRFLQQLGKKGNQVIVSTHSEYLLDPDYLSSVRLMSVDQNNNIHVKNNFNTKAKKGDFLALQPIFDAIGYRYGNQLNIKDNVIVTEGVTDLLYLRAFSKILKYPEPLNIAPGRGDGTIAHIVPLLISQGLNFKIVIDTGAVKKYLQTDYGIEDKFIFEVPIPKPFVGKMDGSGIEDLFSKNDFEKLLRNVGHTPTAKFVHVSNSFYMTGVDIDRFAKRLAANYLYENADLLTKKDFEKETLDGFKTTLDFCNNSDWFYL